MLNVKDILATQDMIDKRHLDIRTITMGISLLDCAHEDVNVCAQRIYDKITRKAENLVKVGEEIEWEFGIPIVNKRISVTPMALIGGSSSIADTFGLEFYADNFYFSLRSQMEGSRQNSFSIQYGRDMTGVSEDIDYTNAKTFLRSLATVSGYGHSIAISETGFGPFARPSLANFSFSEVLEPTQEDPDPEITRLTAASEQYWRANHDPSVSYSASYAPKQDKLTRQFLAEFDDRDVGDTGTVINSELGIETTQRIVYKKSDLLTGITLDVKLGNPPAYMTKPTAWDDTIRFGAPSAVEKQVEAMRNQ